MLRRASQPLGLVQFLMLLIAAVAGGAIYCQLWCVIAFPPTHRMPMPIEASLAWSLSAVAPWTIAFELAKRRDQLAASRAGQAAIAVAALAFSAALSITLELGLDALLGAAVTRPLSLQLAAQLPMAMLVVMLLVVGTAVGRERDAQPRPGSPIAAIISQAGAIDWIAAAGNYVEVSRDGQTSLHRATMEATERALGELPFARVHRSLIVNRRAIAAFATIDGAPAVRLRDGSLHKVSDRYRAALKIPVG